MNGHYYSVTATVQLRVYALSEDEAAEKADDILGNMEKIDFNTVDHLRLDDEDPPEEEHWI